MLDNRTVTEKKKFNLGIATVITIITIAVVAFGLYTLMRTIGKSALSNAASGEVTEETVTREYNGKTYALNEDLVTVLVMGIDTESVTEIGGQSWEAEEGSQLAGGQADALFLAVINPHTRKVSVLAINRNTMTDVDVFDEDGNYVGLRSLQISLQHGFGDGKEQSCERQVKTVSRFLDDVPITSYAAISMDAIPELNDAVGGITVEVLDDIIYPEYDMNLHQGETVTLYGEQAYWYVRLRHEDEFNSAAVRLERQKQYLTTFAAEAKNQATEDYRVALDLWQISQKYMTTDITAAKFSYMATEFLDYDFNVKNLYTLEGTTIEGSTGFEEFYPDDEKLEALIIQLFYEEVTDED